MNDNELISNVAAMWKAGGGDSEGFYYCIGRIHDAIKLLELGNNGEEIKNYNEDDWRKDR